MTRAEAEDAGGEDLGDFGEAVTGAGHQASKGSAILMSGTRGTLRHTEYIPRHFLKCRALQSHLLQSKVVLSVIRRHKAGNRSLETLWKLITMPRFHLPRLSKPGVLEKIESDRLKRLLEPMSGYLENGGFSWPAEGQLTNYKKLGSLLRFPRDGVPAEMILPLVLVDEMSSDGQMDKLLDEAKRRNAYLSLTGDNSPADVAVEVWLRVPTLLQDCHAENLTIRQRNFFHFAGVGSQRFALKDITSEQLKGLEHDRICALARRRSSGKCTKLVHAQPLEQPADSSGIGGGDPGGEFRDLGAG